VNKAEKAIPAVYSAVYATGAVVFLLCLGLEYSGIFRTAAKAVPVVTLLVLVLSRMQGTARICLAGALFGSLCGDILLDLPQAGVFLYGLLAFLAGHLLYMVLFFRYAESPAAFEKAAAAGLVLFALLMILLFRGIDPALYGPVVCYILVIVAMSIGALLVPSAGRLLFAGALLFIASDLVLAVNRFLLDIPYGRLFNIGLYYTAQYLMIFAARGIWRGGAMAEPEPAALSR